MLDWVQDKLRRARAEGWTRLDLGNAGLWVDVAKLQVGIQVLSVSGSLQEYETYREITYHADKLVSYLADLNNQAPQLLEANHFATLKQAIDTRLRALRPS